MDEVFEYIDEEANFTSAGTSHITLNTSRGLEKIEIENIAKLDSDYKDSDLGKLYAEFTESFIKIQKIKFRDKSSFNCYFNTSVKVSILRFDIEGVLSI